MDDCIFCRIVQGEIPCFKIAEDDEFLAFLDLSQFTEGHTLVIPKKHARFVWDVENQGEYFTFISKISNHFRKGLGFKYVDSATFGRDVPHAHYHLIPHNGDNMEWKNALKNIGTMQQDPARRLAKEKGQELALKFKYKD